MKDKDFLHNMYNATSTDDESGEIESYEAWLERQLLSRIEQLEQLDLRNVSKSLSAGQKYQSYLELCSYYRIDVIPFHENWLDQFAVLQKRFDAEFKKVFKENLK